MNKTFCLACKTVLCFETGHFRHDCKAVGKAIPMPRKQAEVSSQRGFEFPALRTHVLVFDMSDGSRRVEADNDVEGWSVELRNYAIDVASDSTNILCGDVKHYYSALKICERLRPMLHEFREMPLSEAVVEILREYRV